MKNINYGCVCSLFFFISLYIYVTINLIGKNTLEQTIRYEKVNIQGSDSLIPIVLLSSIIKRRELR